MENGRPLDFIQPTNGHPSIGTEISDQAGDLRRGKHPFQRFVQGQLRIFQGIFGQP